MTEEAQRLCFKGHHPGRRLKQLVDRVALGWLLMLVSSVANVSGAAERISLRDYVDNLRSQLKQMVEDAKTSDFPLRLRDIQLTIQLAYEVGADGTIKYWVFEAGADVSRQMSQEITLTIDLGGPTNITGKDENQNLHDKPSVGDILAVLDVGAGVHARGIRPSTAPTGDLPPTSTTQSVVDLPLRFEFGSAVLTTNDKKVLDRIAEAMLMLADKKFIIEGHTDAAGNEAYNQALSERRAQAAANYLVSSHGVNQQRLLVIGKGESELLYPDSPLSPLNRRISVIDAGPA